MSCWVGAGLNRLHSNNSQNVSLLTLPRDYLWIFKVKTLQRDVVFGRGRLTSPSLRHVLQRSCKEMFLMLGGCKYITNFSLEVSDPSSSTRLKMHSEGDVCHTACFSSFLWKNTTSFVVIFLIICESLNVSCTDLVKRCLSCWLGGWVGPNYITSQPTFLTNDFQTLHLSYCYISSASSIYIWGTVTMHLLLVLVWVHSRHLPSKAEFLLE